MQEKNFTIYKSSAGSGKTFTLVKEYLALALNDPSEQPQAYRHILAVTFTNKAAAEMKERIIKALKELAEEDYSTVSSGTKNLLIELKKEMRTDRVTCSAVPVDPKSSVSGCTAMSGAPLPLTSLPPWTSYSLHPAPRGGPKQQSCHGRPRH